VLAEAISEAGSVDRDQVRSLLFNLDTMTIIGRFGVDQTGKQVRQQALIIQWQNGQKEIVWPEAIQTAKPRF
jgi:branched-chain amino acid transport system substrate-binding protein